jgi:hypothetical protein
MPRLAMLHTLWRILRTPSGVGPINPAHHRAATLLGHVVIGAALVAVTGTTAAPVAGIAWAAGYWLVKERGDLRRGGGLRDGIEDAAAVLLGTAYAGEWWWPVAGLAAAGAVMLAETRRRA